MTQSVKHMQKPMDFWHNTVCGLAEAWNVTKKWGLVSCKNCLRGKG